MNGYSITLYSEPDEEIVAQGLPLPTIPMPGMIIYSSGGCWKVSDRIQISMSEPGSISYRDKAPTMVSIIVTKAHGIFKS